MKSFSFDSGRQNQNLLRLIDSFEDAQFYFMVTKMMPAGDLVTYLTKQEHQPLSEFHTKKIMLQIARGVRSLH